MRERARKYERAEERERARESEIECGRMRKSERKIKAAVIWEDGEQRRLVCMIYIYTYIYIHIYLNI